MTDYRYLTHDPRLLINSRIQNCHIAIPQGSVSDPCFSHAQEKMCFLGGDRGEY